MTKMSTLRLVFVIILLGFAIYAAISFAYSVSNVFQAQKELDIANKNVGYEYGRCVFYEHISVEQCNIGSNNKGLEQYEKYYGDGSWTVGADPLVE